MYQLRIIRCTTIIACSSPEEWMDTPDTQWYEQFLHVGRLDQALILLGLVLRLPSTSCFFDLHGAIYRPSLIIFLLHSLFYLLMSRGWWDWPLTIVLQYYDTVGWVMGGRDDPLWPAVWNHWRNVLSLNTLWFLVTFRVKLILLHVVILLVENNIYIIYYIICIFS